MRLRTLPVQNPQQLVEIRIAEPAGGRTGQFIGRRPILTNPLWERIRDRQQAFSGAFAWSAPAFDLTTGGEARYAQGLWVSGEFFDTLGVPPARRPRADRRRRSARLRRAARRDQLRLLAARVRRQPVGDRPQR